MPSLENCKHIFALFDQRGIDKKSLSLIPCLIDSRIKYDGLFKDQRTLLRAFAINRGYRCMDIFISKSPKVESLNTNPEGKIYPILTHARGTEVHNQFVELARDVLTGYHQTAEPRAFLYHQWLTEQEDKKKGAFLARLDGILPHCVICGARHERSSAKGFYFESFDRVSRGFLHSDCLAGMLCSALYDVSPGSETFELSLKVIRENARTSVAVLLPHTEADDRQSLRFIQLDPDGNLLLERFIPLDGFTEGQLDGIRDRLFLLLNETLLGYDSRLRNSWLAIHPVNEEQPELILKEVPYRRVQEFHRLVADTVAGLSDQT